MKKTDLENQSGLERKVLSGIGVSSGYAMGKVQLLLQDEEDFAEKSISTEEIQDEIAMFSRAVEESLVEVEQLRDRIRETVGVQESRIFDSHIMLLQDPFWLDEVSETIRTDLIDAISAFRRRFKKIEMLMGRQKSQGAQQRMDDLRDVYHRVVTHMLPQIIDEDKDGEKPVIASYSLTPSFVSGMTRDRVLALLSETGGINSHASIIARSLRIPAVSGLMDIAQELADEQFVIVDGVMGMVIINPTPADLEEYTRKLHLMEERQKLFLSRSDAKCQTVDGVQVRLLANLGLVAEASSVLFNGGDGVGLFRSEYLFFDGNMPSEDEQFEQYKGVLTRLAPHPVTIRTLDAGGDKFIAGLSAHREENPFMGWRSVRLCLDSPELFQTQLRALLRASVHGTLQIMFPLISSLDEWNQCVDALNDAKAELDRAGILYDKGIRVGMMVEVPSAVIMAEEFARVVDFMSIGTNDLVQFLLAVDRTNERVQARYQPHHPAVLRSIDRVCKAARSEGKPVSICGEMASDKDLIPVLIGLGVRDLSMSPWLIPEKKDWIRSLTFEACRNAALRCLEYDSSERVRSYLEQFSASHGVGEP